MALTNLSQVTSSGIHTLSNYTTHNINSTGIITATEFSGNLSNSSGISTFAEIRVTGNLTVEGTTTTLDSNLTEVDRIEVGANSTNPGVAVTQSGTGHVATFEGGNFGIGINNPAYALDVKQTDTTNPLTIAAKGGTDGGGYFWESNSGTTYGAVGYGKLITANSGSTNSAITTWGSQDLLLGTNRVERLRITSTGNIGIGTVNAVAKVDIITGTGDGTQNEANCLRLRNRGNNGNAMTLQVGVNTAAAGALNQGYAYLQGRFWGGGNNPILLNPKGGNVGIGRTQAYVPLDVNGDTILRTAGQTTQGDITRKLGFTGPNATSNPHSYIAGVADQSQWYQGFGLVFGTVRGNDIGNTLGVERMRITSDGLIGIGTANPRYPLEVNSGNLLVSGSAAGNLILEDRGVGDSSRPFTLLASNDGNFTITNANRNASGTTTSSAERFRITSDGKVAIGFNAPAVAGLSIANSSTSLGFEFDTASGFASGPTIRGYHRPSTTYKSLGITGADIKFGINDVEKLRLDSNGYLGLNNAAPHNQYYNNLVIGDGSASGDKGITIRTQSSNEGVIAFSDADSGAARYAGKIAYNHGTNAMMFFTTNGDERLRITSSGSALLTTEGQSAQYSYAMKLGQGAYANSGTTSPHYGLWVRQLGPRYALNYGVYSEVEDDTGMFGGATLDGLSSVRGIGVFGGSPTSATAYQKGIGVYGKATNADYNYNTVIGVRGRIETGTTSFLNNNGQKSYGGHFVATGKSNVVGVYADAYLDGSPGANQTAAPLVVASNGSEKLRVDANGRISVNSNANASDANEGAQLRVTGTPLTRNQYYSPAGNYYGSFGYTDNTYTKSWISVDSSYNKTSSVSSGIFLSAFHSDANGSACGHTIKNVRTDAGGLIFSAVHAASSTGNPAVESERLRITTSGQVNIGGNFTQTGFTANITRNSSETDILRIKGNGANAFIRFEDNDASSSFTLGADDAVGSNGFALYDRNDSAYRLVVDTSGYLGINHTSPGTRLVVKQNNGVAYNGNAQSVAYGAAAFINESGHTSGGTYTGYQFNLKGNSQNRICSIGAITHASNNRTSSLVFHTDEGGNRTEKLRIAYNGNLSMPAGGAIYSTHSANTAITPSSNDWIDVARIPYAAEVAGEVIIRWANLHAPACCHHGHMRFNIGSSHGPTYNYQWSASLSMTEAQAHNSFWFKAARLIIQNISGSNYLYLQVQANTNVTSGTFRNTITRSKRTVDAGTHIEYLTPNVSNRTGTIARYLHLQNAGSEERVTVPHTNKIQNALGGNAQVEGSLNIGGHLSWGGYIVEKVGERKGSGTYTIFTNGNGSTQSAGIVEIMAIYGTPSGAAYWKYKISGNRNIYLMDSNTTGYGGANPSLSWNGANLEVSNNNSSVYYTVHVKLFQIGIGWGETWGNLPGISN